MEVKCIRNDFPQITSTGDKKHNGIQPLSYPKVNEILTVDEILGDFYRFEKYDTTESYNWWHMNRFIIVENDFTVETDKLKAISYNYFY